MPWVLTYVGLAVAGLLVLVACAVRVHVRVRALGRQVHRTRARLAAAGTTAAKARENAGVSVRAEQRTI